MSLASLALAIAIVCAPAPAKADITMSVQMSIDMPAMRKMPADQRAAMDRYLSSTIYIQGKKFRYDNALVSVIVDRQAMTMTTVSKMAKAFSVAPFDPAKARLMMPGGGLSSAGPLKSYELADEGSAGAYLGHKVRRYLLTEQLSLPNAGLERIRATILSAQDLAPADMASYASLSSSMPGKVHMKGFPLKMNMTMTGGKMGTMTMAMLATSVSTSSIPASVFEVPAGYTQANPSTGPQTTSPPAGGNPPQNGVPNSAAPGGSTPGGAPPSNNSGPGNGGAPGSNNGATGGSAPGNGSTPGGNGGATGGGPVPNRGTPVPPPPPI